MVTTLPIPIDGRQRRPGMAAACTPSSRRGETSPCGMTELAAPAVGEDVGLAVAVKLGAALVASVTALSNVIERSCVFFCLGVVQDTIDQQQYIASSIDPRIVKTSVPALSPKILVSVGQIVL